MIDPKIQPLRVTIEFTYDAELYEGDPTDAFAIAALELEAIQDGLEGAVDSVLGETRAFRVRVVPE